MEKSNRVFIATSIDGYIADKNGGIEWLDSVPEMNTIDSGYAEFTSKIDAIVMGKNTFEKVLSFGIEWPYKKPVFVVSNSLQTVPAELEGKVQLVKGTPAEILKVIHSQSYGRLYIDGGKLIQSFLESDLIDKMVITIIPVLLGGGYPLFSEMTSSLNFRCTETKHFLDAVVQNHYERK